MSDSNGLIMQNLPPLPPFWRDPTPYVMVQRMDLPACPDRHEVTSARRHILERLDSRRKAALPDSISRKSAALLFEGLVNYSLLFLTRSERLEIIVKALGGDERDVEHWHRPQPGDNLVDWASKRMGTTSLLMALALGDVLGMKPEYIFSRFPNCPTTPSKALLTKQPLAFLKQIAVYGNLFDCTAVDALQNYCDEVVQYVVRYSSQHGDILAFASREVTTDGVYAFRIGFRPPDAILPSRELFDASPNAPVVFCLEPAVTLKMRQIAREARLLERSGVIITGLYGGQSEADAIDLTPLTFRDVVIVASPGQDCWAFVETFARRCKAKKPNSLKLYPWPVLYHGLRLNPNGIPDNAKEHIEEHGVFLDEVERPSLLTQRIVQEAIDIGALAQWKSSIGLTNCKRSAQDDDAIALSDFRKFKDVPYVPLRKVGDPISLREFFNPNDISLIWAPSDAGKSLFIQDIVLRMVTGDRFFLFDANEPCSVLVLDGEVGDYYKARAKQLVQSGCVSDELIDENLTVKYCRGESILSQNYQKIVMSAIERDNVSVLVIDNLNSNAPEAVDGNPTKLMNFLGEVANNGVSIIMIHHSTKEGDKYFGKHQLLTRSQNVIRLYNRDQIKELAKEEQGFRIPHEVKSMMDDKASAVMLLEVTKSKVAPDLANQRHFFVLPYGGVWRMVDEDQPKSSSALDSEDDGPQIRLPVPKTPVLPDESTGVAKRPQTAPSAPACGHPSTVDDSSAFNAASDAQSPVSVATPSQCTDKSARALTPLASGSESPVTQDNQNGSDEMLAPVESVDEIATPESENSDSSEFWHGKLPDCPLPPEADAVLRVMRQDISYARRHIQAKLSNIYTKNDIRRALKILSEVGLVHIDGKGRGTIYRLK